MNLLSGIMDGLCYNTYNLIKTFQIKFAAFFVVVNMRVFNNIKICVYQRNNPADQHLGWVYDATAQEVLN